jgi:ring-1,2-phenylacetyl-CoA epoxidase subunit PaaD
VPDPEIPVLCLDDLGMVRGLSLDPDGTVVAKITPTYSGCPATDWIAGEVANTLSALGAPKNCVQVVLDPAWTTDWISEEGAKKLKAYGIAPPSHKVNCLGSNGASAGGADTVFPLTFTPAIACPRCNSKRTENLSEFGSTPCKALYRCLNCQEPFDYFKPF